MEPQNEPPNNNKTTALRPAPTTTMTFTMILLSEGNHYNDLSED